MIILHNLCNNHANFLHELLPISARRRRVRPGAELRDLGPSQPAAHARAPRLVRRQRVDQAPAGRDMVGLHRHAQEVGEEPSGETPGRQTLLNLFIRYYHIFIHDI